MKIVNISELALRRKKYCKVYLYHPPCHDERRKINYFFPKRGGGRERHRKSLFLLINPKTLTIGKKTAQTTSTFSSHVRKSLEGAGLSNISAK